jgi:hypothetical protein
MESIQECGQLVIPGVAVTMTASTAVTSTYVNATGCEFVDCVLWLAASVAGATSVGRIEIVAASAANGTGAEAVTFKDLYKTLGATTIAQGTGRPARLEQTSSNVPTAIAFYDTLAADGDKQQQYVIPVRVRHLPAGKPYVAVRFTAGSATARSGLVMFIRRDPMYKFDGGVPSSIFA